MEELVLTDRVGMPWFWPNVFTASEYRNASMSPNTQAKVLRTLGMALLWAQSKGRDLDVDMSVGNFLDMSDVEELADFLSLSAEEQERRCKAPDQRVGRKVVRLESFRPDHRDLRVVRSEIGNQEIATRIRWIARYIEWHLDRRIGSLERHRLASESLRIVGPKVVARLRQLAPRAQSKSEDDVTLEGVDFKVLQLAEEAMRPGSPENPFLSDFVQARNYLIWRLLLDTGARRGEVHAAKADDIKFSMRRFEIRVSKTLARTVPISPRTAEVFDAFIERFWSRLPKDARGRGYLFTNHNGKHIALKAINRIPGTPEGDHFVALGIMLQRFEEKNCSSEAPV